MSENLSRLPSLMVNRVATHWNPSFGRSLVWKILILAGICRAAVRLPRPVQIWLIGLPLISTLAAALLYTVGGRFLVPLYGLLFTLAGYGGYGLLHFAWVFVGRFAGSEPSDS